MFDLVHVDVWGRLIVADIVVSSGSYVFPRIHYRLSVLLLCKNRKKVLECLLSLLLWDGGNHQRSVSSVRIMGG